MRIFRSLVGSIRAWFERQVLDATALSLLPSGAGMIALFGLLFPIYLYFTPDPARINMDGETLRLTGSSGQEQKLVITGHSVASHWASSTGLRLDLGENDLHLTPSSQVLVPPKQKKWDDTIVYSRRADHEFEIPAAFVFPALRAAKSEQGAELRQPLTLVGAERRTVTGTIVGNIQFPSPRGRKFSDTSARLSIPVVLELVSADVASNLERERRRPYVRLALILLSVAALSVPYTILCLRIEKRAKA